MNLVKILISFTFLLTFGFQVTAQEETPKVVWKNLQEKYEKFEDVKPSIINNESTAIYFYEPEYSVALYYFDESLKIWEPSEPFMCLTGVKLSYLKVKPNQEYILSFSKYYWDIHLEERTGFGNETIESLYLSSKGKFKLSLNFRLGKSGIHTLSMSPEFIVTPNSSKFK